MSAAVHERCAPFHTILCRGPVLSRNSLLHTLRNTHGCRRPLPRICVPLASFCVDWTVAFAADLHIWPDDFKAVAELCIVYRCFFIAGIRIHAALCMCQSLSFFCKRHALKACKQRASSTPCPSDTCWKPSLCTSTHLRLVATLKDFKAPRHGR